MFYDCQGLLSRHVLFGIFMLDNRLELCMLLENEPIFETETNEETFSCDLLLSYQKVIFFFSPCLVHVYIVCPGREHSGLKQLLMHVVT